MSAQQASREIQNKTVSMANDGRQCPLMAYPASGTTASKADSDTHKQSRSSKNRLVEGHPYVATCLTPGHPYVGHNPHTQLKTQLS
ncbi:hypothetical protein TNCV_3782411 [Trichonephila clavipes]|nr:hypothetical protein TNCV_3782411 [Trichonephila clavipes]